MDPKTESKWNQDLEKESPELILDALKASAKKWSKIVTRNSPGKPDKAREPGLCALNKETT